VNWPAYPAYHDPGAEWLTHIPAHWLTTKLKWSASLITSGSRGWAQFYADEGEYFVRIGNLNRGALGFNDSEVQYVQIPAGAEGSRTMTRSGDLLFSITAYLGSVAVVDSVHAGAYVSQHVSLVRLMGRRLDALYAGYVSLSEV
jgi:type I restriction enzyme, S subunit